MFKFFHLEVFCLLNAGFTLYFVKPYVSMWFNVLADVLLDHFYVSTPVSLSYIVTHVDVIKIDMLDFVVIIGIDLFRSC